MINTLLTFIAMFALVYGALVAADYTACTSQRGFTYDWSPMPHCNFHLLDAIEAK
jgi:hypothetical protein